MEIKNTNGRISNQMMKKIKEILQLRMIIENIQKKDEELDKIISNIWENGDNNINFFTLNDLNAFVDRILDYMNKEIAENYSNKKVSYVSLDKKAYGTATATATTLQSSGSKFFKKDCNDLKKPRSSRSLKKNIRPFKFNQYEKIEKRSIKFYNLDSCKNIKGNIELEMIDNAQQEIMSRVQRGKMLQSWVHGQKKKENSDDKLQ